ncbi:MAG: metallophosphoesterase [Gammaproteobacteria bacterium]|nr:metallophosphoesterase [Gammaproteobacteria bacterium]
MSKKVLRLPLNQRGRDYVVGDIHGYFSLLEVLLDHAGFDSRVDRLICVGDLIDRGPESEKAIEYLQQPWLYTVKGNHEELLMRAAGPFRSVDGSFDLWMRVGGEWALDADSRLLDRMRALVDPLPLAIEVETPRGRIGVVHADVPQGMSWDELLVGLEQDKLKSEQMRELLWSRDRYKRMKSGELAPTSPQAVVTGVYRVFVGHSIVPGISQMGNVCFIDTGVSWEGSLSLINLHTEQVFSIPVKA